MEPREAYLSPVLPLPLRLRDGEGSRSSPLALSVRGQESAQETASLGSVSGLSTLWCDFGQVAETVCASVSSSAAKG